MAADPAGAATSQRHREGSHQSYWLLEQLLISLASDYNKIDCSFAMKMVSWNCNGALWKKKHLLEELAADIFVIQECENPSATGKNYGVWAQNFHWIGENRHRGLGIFARNHHTLQKLEWNDSALQLFLPCRVNDAFNLVAVWTKRNVEFGYIWQFWTYLNLHKAEIAGHSSVICGDFNSNTCWDKPRRRWNHSNVVQEMQEIDVHSLYHSLTGEKQGQETIPTFYMHRKAEKPYHIDYAFASRNILAAVDKIEVGHPEIWLKHSDHMPLKFYINA